MAIPENPARTTSRSPAFAVSLILACSWVTALPAAAQEYRPGWQPEGDAWGQVSRTIEPSVSVPPAAPSEFLARRTALAAALGETLEEPVAVWIPARGFNELDPFFQSDDFYYLSGIETPDVSLLMVVDADGSLVGDTLFLAAKDPIFELWNGERLAPGPEATQQTGFASTALLPGAVDGWTEILAETGVGQVLTLAEPPWPAPEGVEVLSGRMGGPTSLRRVLSALRLLKSDYEIACLQASIDITCAALRNAVTAVKPGAYEYQAQAELEGTYRRLGAERIGFSSIFGSGPNSVTLHYNSNRRQMQDGELMVMDVGSKYRYYCADVTRTVPVNGRFTDRQREVYETVLRAQTAAAEAARPGMTIKDLDDIARKVIVDAGFERKHFPHSVGHWIGLDVHDVGGRVPIEVGSLFTIEPGIYIAEEALGVRIEDDYLMTADGAVKLSTGFPSDPDAVEALLASRT